MFLWGFLLLLFFFFVVVIFAQSECVEIFVNDTCSHMVY